MKRISFLIILLIGFVSASFQAVAQRAKVSSIMVFPHDQYCIAKGYSIDYKDPVSGVVSTVPDYNKAFQNDPDLIQVIAKIEGIFADRGFPLENLKATLDGIKQDRAEEAVVLGKAGKTVDKSPYDEVTETARPDVALYVLWDITGQAPKRQISFTLLAVDAYTKKTIAAKSGVGEPSLSNNTAAMLQEAVLTHIDNLITSLSEYRESIETRGREIILRLRIAEGAGFDFETECNGKELNDLIEDWLTAHAKGGEFKAGANTETRLQFTNVRIDLIKDEKAYDAKAFGKELEKYLKTTCPAQSKIKLQARGLGGVDLYLGAKTK